MRFAVPVGPSFRMHLVLVLALVVGVGVEARAAEPRWTLDLDGRTYAYTVTLTSELPESALLDILFDPRHVALFSRSAGRLVLLQQEGAVNEVRFDTRRMFFKCSSTFRRTLDRETASIDIEMLSFSAGWGKLAPHAISSRARYTVVDRGTFREITYRQFVETDRPVAGLSLRLIRKSLEQFSRDLHAYLQEPDVTAAARAGAAGRR